MKRSRRIIHFLAVIMILSTITVTVLSTASFSSQKVSISLIPNPKIDIVLAKSKTSTNLTNFESDILNALKSKNINTSQVKVSAVETVSAEINESDAKKIYETWKSYTVGFSRASLTPSLNSYTPTIASDEWTISGDKIQRNTANSTLSMFVSPDYNDDTNVEFTTQFGLNVANSSIHGEAWYFFKIDESMKNGYGLVWDNHTACGPFSNADYQLYLIKMTNGAVSVLQSINVAPWAVGKYWNADIKVVNNKATIKITGTNSVTWTNIDVSMDSETTQAFGTFAFNGSYFSHNTITREVVKEFSEVLRQPEWRQDAIKVMVNVDDYENEELSKGNTLSELLTRLLNENIHFVSWGNNTNKAQFENLIKSNNNKGLFVNNTNYNTSIEQTATYIKKLIDEITPDEEYVILGDPISIKVDPADAMNNTADSNYPYGKWKITHDFEYYENNIGQFSESGKYINNFINTFDKTGRYQILYEDKAVTPENIYVHRRPIAEIGMKREGNSITLTSNSYDLDSYSMGNKGICEEKWEYKKATDTVWTTGKLTSVTGEDDYIIQLSVKDFQNTWSVPKSVYITNSANVPPVASFNLKSETITRYDNLEIVDGSYDPAGGTITKHNWEVYKGDTKIYEGANPPTNYKDKGVGNYSIYLTVTNAKGKVSERYGRTFTVIEDTIAPEVVVKPVESDWVETVTVSLEFSDKGGSEFKNYQYAITDSQSVPTSWSAGIAKKTDNITINQEGLNYLHIKATDNAGNTSDDRCVGPFRIDKTNPTINYTGNLTDIQMDYVDIKLEAKDEWSGIKSFTVNGNEIENGVARFTENGTYTLVATDNTTPAHTTTLNLVIKNVYYNCTAGLDHPIYSSSYKECPICESFKGLAVTENSSIYNGQEQQVKYDNPKNAKIVEYYNGSTTKPVKAGNYEYELKVVYENTEYQTGVKGTYTILPKELTITDIIAQDKIYNGNNSIVLSGGRLLGIVDGDEVRFSMPYAGNTESKNVGKWKVAVDTITLEGEDSSNYTLKQPEYGSILGNITKRLLTVVNIEGKNRIYNGSKTVDIVNGEIVGLIENDDVVITIPKTGESESENVGTWNVRIEPITLTGEDVENYRFIQPGKGDIQVTISVEEGKLIIGCDNKLYDREKIKPYVVEKNSTSEVQYTYYKSGTEEVAEQPFDIGIYDVVGFIETDGNYTEATSNKVTFEIKRPEEPLLKLDTKIININEQEIQQVVKEDIKVEYQDEVVIEMSIENLGKGSGYVQSIISKLPEGVELAKDNEINTKYGWQQTEDGEVKTTKLSLESDINNEIFPATENSENDNITKQTVQMVLKISDSSKQEKDLLIENTIIQQDKRGDIISYKEENMEYSKTIESMKLEYLDLQVRNRIIEIYERDINTNVHTKYDIYQKPKEIVKLDLAPKKVGSCELIVVYKVEITNLGNRKGNIQKITEILPKGVSFSISDNPDWSIDSFGNAVYEKEIQDILPNETKEVEMKLRWNATEDNLSARTAYAMIDAKGEVDQKLIEENKISINETNNYDSSEMILSLITGKMIALWITLFIICVAIFICGVTLIKKYVI